MGAGHNDNFEGLLRLLQGSVPDDIDRVGCTIGCCVGRSTGTALLAHIRYIGKKTDENDHHYY